MKQHKEVFGVSVKVCQLGIQSFITLSTKHPPSCSEHQSQVQKDTSGPRHNTITAGEAVSTQLEQPPASAVCFRKLSSTLTHLCQYTFAWRGLTPNKHAQEHSLAGCYSCSLLLSDAPFIQIKCLVIISKLSLLLLILPLSAQLTSS